MKFLMFVAVLLLAGIAFTVCDQASKSDSAESKRKWQEQWDREAPLRALRREVGLGESDEIKPDVPAPIIAQRMQCQIVKGIVLKREGDSLLVDCNARPLVADRSQDFGRFVDARTGKAGVAALAELARKDREDREEAAMGPLLLMDAGVLVPATWKPSRAASGVVRLGGIPPMKEAQEGVPVHVIAAPITGGLTANFTLRTGRATPVSAPITLPDPEHLRRQRLESIQRKYGAGQ
ncbi:MAG TPA: hypothetical protein VF614_02295 [Chthoniobacteraceae bacterium]|jgi:hypothetical protein